jgi:hypothetical protein
MRSTPVEEVKLVDRVLRIEFQKLYPDHLSFRRGDLPFATRIG